MMKHACLPLLITLCLSSCFALQACGSSTTSNCSEVLSGLDIPPALAVPSGQRLQVAYYAKGLQHYSFNGSAWVLFNATADLYPVQEKVGARKLGGGLKAVVGQHFFLGHPDAAGGQPSWETSTPAYSLVTARTLQAVTVDPSSITWNLLQATSHNGNKDALGAVTYVQRLASKGGLPPSTTLGAHAGDIHVTPYSIFYFFYTNAV